MLLLARCLQYCLFEIALAETANDRRLCIHRRDFLLRKRTMIFTDPNVRQKHCPSKFQKLRARFQRKLFTTNRALADDAIVKTRRKLSEKYSTPKAILNVKREIIFFFQPIL